MSYLVEMKDILNFLGLNAETTADRNIDLIRLGVEEWIQTVHCRRTLVSANYKERYDGTGDQFLLLDNYPITVVNRLSIDTDDAIKIRNTDASSQASVSVSATAITLSKDGTSNSLSLATYTTLTTLVEAINAVAGWEASLMMASYGSYPSTILVEKFGLYCGNSTWNYLEMPDVGEEDFEVYSTEGKIYLYSGFPEGRRNIYTDYVAGYTTIPDDLKLATLILIKNIYQRRSEESFGNTSYSVSGISLSFEQDGIPIQVKQILHKYKRTLI